MSIQSFIREVGTLSDPEQVWDALVEFARERGFHTLIYGMKGEDENLNISTAYHSNNQEWLQHFLSSGHYNYCYFTIKGLVSAEPYMGGLEYLPEPWRSDKNFSRVMQEAFDAGLKRALAMPLCLAHSESGLNGIAFHTDLSKEQFEENVKLYQDELMTAALYANSWLIPWIRKKTVELEEPTFSKRQQEVFELYMRGIPNKEIAFSLGISQPTVSYHLKEVMTRLGVSKPREIMARAAALNII